MALEMFLGSMKKDLSFRTFIVVYTTIFCSAVVSKPIETQGLE